MARKKGTPGRPLLLTQALADEIFVRMLAPESIRSICADEKMPAKSTLLLWLSKGTDKTQDEIYAWFLDRYTRVKALQAELLIDDVPEIVDDAANDYMEVTRKDGTADVIFNGENVQRSRLRVDARFRLAEMLAPNKYGKRVALDHGGQPQNPFLAVVEAAAGSQFVPPGAEEGEQ